MWLLGFYLVLMKCVSVVVGMVDCAHFHMAYKGLASVLYHTKTGLTQFMGVLRQEYHLSFAVENSV